MAQYPGAYQGVGRRSPTRPCLLTDRTERVGRAADRHRSARRRDHALADPYSGKSRSRAGLCAALSAAGLIPGGRQEAGGCDDGPGTDRTVPKPGQERSGCCPASSLAEKECKDRGNQMRPLTEQVILITGATDGLGKAVAMQLARAGATLLLHGRDEARGQRTLEEIEAQTGNTRLQWYRADFSELSQVRALAARLAREQECLDVLVNNAGIGTTLPRGGARQESEDGYELRFAVNYLAPFLLTRL